MAREHFLDLYGIDVDPAADHHVAVASAQEQVVVSVDEAEVVDRHPRSIMRVVSRRPVAQIPVHRLLVANPDCADLASLQRLALVVRDAQIVPFEHLPHRPGAGEHFAPIDQRDPAKLRGAVEVEHVGRAEPFNRAESECVRKRRGTGDDRAQRGGWVRSVNRIGKIDDAADHRRDHERRVHAPPRHRRQRVLGVELCAQDQCAAERRHHHRERLRATMVERAHDEVTIPRPHRQSIADP